MSRKSAAFTIIELLLVVAIIGILASVVLARVGGAKASAQKARTEASMRSAQTAATFCMDSSNDLNTPDIANLICAGQGNWPAPVGFGWAYGNFGTCSFDGDVSDNTFMFCANDGVKVISCTETGCVTT